jgi:hypothetical protein
VDKYITEIMDKMHELNQNHEVETQHSEYLNFYLVGFPSSGDFCEDYSCALVYANSIEESKKNYGLFFITNRDTVSIPCITDQKAWITGKDRIDYIDYSDSIIFVFGVTFHNEIFSDKYDYKYVRVVLLPKEYQYKDARDVHYYAQKIYEDHLMNLLQKKEWDGYSIDLETFTQHPDETTQIPETGGYAILEWRKLPPQIWNERKFVSRNTDVPEFQIDYDKLYAALPVCEKHSCDIISKESVPVKLSDKYDVFDVRGEILYLPCIGDINWIGMDRRHYFELYPIECVAIIFASIFYFDVSRYQNMAVVLLPKYLMYNEDTDDLQYIAQAMYTNYIEESRQNNVYKEAIILPDNAPNPDAEYGDFDNNDYIIHMWKIPDEAWKIGGNKS